VFCKNRGPPSQPQKSWETFSLFSSRRDYKLGSDDFRANLIADSNESGSVFFHRDFHWRSAGVSAVSIGAGLAVAAIFPTAKARS
jgi:hypothetical protein